MEPITKSSVVPTTGVVAPVYVYYRLYERGLPFGTTVFATITAARKNFPAFDTPSNAAWVLYSASSYFGHRVWTRLIGRTATTPAGTDVIEECVPAS